MKQRVLSGFTLLEILLVVAAIGILAGIVILAINPNKQLGDTKNAQRKADINTILNATYQYAIDNNGNFPTTITSAAKEICETTSDCQDLVDLGVLIDNEKYLTSIPIDPKGAVVTGGTGYNIEKTTNGRIKISAPQAEQGLTISVTR